MNLDNRNGGWGCVGLILIVILAVTALWIGSLLVDNGDGDLVALSQQTEANRHTEAMAQMREDHFQQRLILLMAVMDSHEQEVNWLSMGLGIVAGYFVLRWMGKRGWLE